MTPQRLSRLSDIIADYDALLLDLWGVIHDGSALYPQAKACLQALKAEGKRVVFLSNAPRRLPKVVAVLDMLGVERDLYEGALSSGEAAYRALAAGEVKPGRTYCFIGPERDADVLNGLPFTRVDTPETADFLLNAGFGTEEQTLHDFTRLLQAAHTRGLPMLCLNPDMEVVKITGERYPCAGVIAKQYEAMGGKVTWFGKPYPAVYQLAITMLEPVAKARILAVGDGLYTDILGANNASIDSVLVTGGILQGNWRARADTPAPLYVMNEMQW